MIGETRWISVFFAATLTACSITVDNTRSTPLGQTVGQRIRNAEVRFQNYGPFTFMGKHRIQHEWLHEDPRGSHYCQGYDSVREREIDELGEKRPARIGMDTWEEEGRLLQRNPYFKPDGVSDMTRFVIGKYLPKAPGGPRYSHEHMCRTYFEPLANEYELWLKKSSLDTMRIEDQNSVATRWNYARLLKPIAYEAIQFANLPAQRVTWIYSFAPKGMENNPTPFVKEEIRVPIGDTGYVYQLAFTLSDMIVQNEPEKAARRKAYWRRIQDSFRIEALQQ